MFRIASISALCALSFTPAALADTEPPRAVIEDVSEDALDYMSDDRLAEQELDQLLTDVDVDGIARFALGKYSKRLNDTQYAQYEAAFKTYLRSQLREHLGRFAGTDVEIDDVHERNSRDAIVETKVTKADGEVIDVNWRLRRSSGGWEVIDIEAMNLWLAIEQRAQFTAQLDDNGGDIDALVQELRTAG